MDKCFHHVYLSDMARSVWLAYPSSIKFYIHIWEILSNLIRISNVKLTSKQTNLITKHINDLINARFQSRFFLNNDTRFLCCLVNNQFKSNKLWKYWLEQLHSNVMLMKQIYKRKLHLFIKFKLHLELIILITSSIYFVNGDLFLA